MSDPISGKIAAEVAQAGLSEAGTQGPGPAKPEDVASFSEAMQAPVPAEAHAGSPAQGMQNHAAEEGTSFMRGVDDLSANLRSMQSNLEQSVGGAGGEVGELLKTQFEVARLTMTQTMVGQVGQKTSQGTQQLLKGQ